DIGADEFNGVVRNYDLSAEDITAPFGYRPSSGQYSDAEYVMVGSGPVPVTARVRNVGGSPFVQNTVTMSVERWNGSSWVSAGSTTSSAVTTSVDVSAATGLNFGT